MPNINTYVAVIVDWFGKEQINPTTKVKKRYAGLEFDIDNQYIFSNNVILGLKAGVFVPGSYYDGLMDSNAYSIVGYLKYKFLTNYN